MPCNNGCCCRRIASARAATQGRRQCTGRDGQHLQALAKKATTGLVSSMLHCDAEMLTEPNKSIALQPLSFIQLTPILQHTRRLLHQPPPWASSFLDRTRPRSLPQAPHARVQNSLRT